MTSDFIVLVNGKQVWNKKGGDGDCTKNTVNQIVENIKESL